MRINVGEALNSPLQLAPMLIYSNINDNMQIFAESIKIFDQRALD